MAASRGTKILGMDSPPYGKRTKSWGAAPVRNAAAINNRVDDYMKNIKYQSGPDATYGLGPTGRTEGARTRGSETAQTRVTTRSQDMGDDAYNSGRAQIEAYNAKHTTPHSSPDPHTPNYKVGGTPMKLMKKKVK